MWLSENEDVMISCGDCYTLDWRTMVAHLMMCNYAEGRASQRVVEIIEDTHAKLPTDSYVSRIASLAYPINGVCLFPDIAKSLCLPLPIVYCYRLQWLRLLAAALEDAEVLTLSVPVVGAENEEPTTLHEASEDDAARAAARSFEWLGLNGNSLPVCR